MKILFVVYDNAMHINRFPQGLGYITAVLKQKGYHVDIYSQDVNHWPSEHLTEYLDNNEYDVVGVSIIAGYYQFRKLLEISEAVNKSRNRPYYMLGGHGPSPDPEYFMRITQADAVVMGEGEETVIELMEGIKGNIPYESIPGIAYRDGSRVQINERRELISNIDEIPFPAYEDFPVHYYRLLRFPKAAKTDFVMPMLSGRGCKFKCNFCYRMDEGFRARSSDSIIEEVKLLQADYGITYIAFSDELLVSSIQRTTELCEAFIHQGLKFKWWCNGRLNWAKPDVLKLMRKAGCVFINYGIESMDDQVLKNMNKALTVKQIEQGIENTLKAGISPGFNIIFGNIGENREILQKGVDFLIKYDDGAQLRTIRPVTPIRGLLCIIWP